MYIRTSTKKKVYARPTFSSFLIAVVLCVLAVHSMMAAQAADATQASSSATIAQLYRRRGLPVPPFPNYVAPSKHGNKTPVKELRGGHRPAPSSIGTVAEPLSSSYHATTKGLCSIRALGWSIDGRRLASSASDRTIRIWTPELSVDARATSELLGHTDGVWRIVWDPMHPERLASASSDKKVKFWDVRQAKETASIDTPGANINIAYHPQGNYVAVGDREDTISIIDSRTYKSVGLIRSQGSSPDLTSSSAKWLSNDREEINEFSWTPDGQIFVLGTGGGNVRLLDARNLDIHMEDAPAATSATATDPAGPSKYGPALHWPLVHTIVAHTATVLCISVDPLGRYLATASVDGTTALWTLNEWFNVSMSGHLTYPARSISFSHDGEFLAAAGEDKFISITATSPMDHSTSGVDSQLHKIAVNANVNGLAWHPSKNFLAYAGDDRDGAIRIWGMP